MTARTCHLLHGNDHLIEYNEMHHAVEVADDMGVVYMGRDPSEAGIVIRYNFLHHNGSDVGATGVLYYDDGSCGVTAFGNVFYHNKGGTWINGGYNHRFENNIFVDDKAAIRDGWGPQSWHDWSRSDFMNNRLRVVLDITQPPYSERYPDLLRLYNADPADPTQFGQDVVRNVSVRSGDFGTGRNRLQDNWVTDEDPGFVNPAAMDFALKPESAVFAKVPGFQAIPFEEIGLYVGDYRASLVLDAPAIESPAEFISSTTVSIGLPRHATFLTYTVDGTEPTAGSSRYEKPFTLNDSAVVRARAFAGEADGTGGAVATRSVRCVPVTLLSEASVNFGPRDMKVPEGWLNDYGGEFSLDTHNVAHGWTPANLGAIRLRGKNDDPVLDTLIHFVGRGVWQMAVANGTYELTVCLGDAEFECQGATVYVEGKPFAEELKIKAGEFQRVTGEVVVSDGMLTLSSNNAPTGLTVTRMEYLEFRKVE